MILPEDIAGLEVEGGMDAFQIWEPFVAETAKSVLRIETKPS
jgi:hypothetical protein